MTYGPQCLHLPLVCFELEFRDVEIGFFFDSDPAYDLLLVTTLWLQRQTCHLWRQFPVQVDLVAWADRL
jgi:hypothetical protein